MSMIRVIREPTGYQFNSFPSSNLDQSSVPLIKPLDYGITPMMFGLMLNKNLEVADLLIEAGANLEAGDRNGLTPLMGVAAHLGLGQTLLLLNAGTRL